jgi:hypothetical protein
LGMGTGTGVEMRLGKSRSRWAILGDVLGMWILKKRQRHQTFRTLEYEDNCEDMK